MGILINVSLIILAIGGIWTSGYLIYKRNDLKTMVCPLGGHCEKVLTSKYNKIFFVKNDILGVLYYIFILIFAISIPFLSDKLITYELIISGGALLFSAYLVFVQAKVIHQYCFYCLVSALINFFIFLNILFL